MYAYFCNREDADDETGSAWRLFWRLAGPYGRRGGAGDDVCRRDLPRLYYDGGIEQIAIQFELRGGVFQSVVYRGSRLRTATT